MKLKLKIMVDMGVVCGCMGDVQCLHNIQDGRSARVDVANRNRIQDCQRTKFRRVARWEEEGNGVMASLTVLRSIQAFHQPGNGL